MTRWIKQTDSLISLHTSERKDTLTRMKNLSDMAYITYCEMAVVVLLRAV